MKMKTIRAGTLCIAATLGAAGLAQAQNSAGPDANATSSTTAPTMTASSDNSVATTTAAPATDTTPPPVTDMTAPAGATTTTERHGFDAGWLGLIGLAGLLGLRRRPNTTTVVSDRPSAGSARP